MSVLVTSVHQQRLDIETKALRSVHWSQLKPPCWWRSQSKKMLSSHDVLVHTRAKKGEKKKNLPIQWKFFCKIRQIEVNNIRIPFISKWALEATTHWGKRLTSSAFRFVFIRLTVISPSTIVASLFTQFFTFTFFSYSFNNRHQRSRFNSSPSIRCSEFIVV